MIRYEATIYDRREHWTFTVKIDGETKAHAEANLRANYPKREYAIRSLQFDNTYPGNFS